MKKNLNFKNHLFNKKELKQLIYDVFTNYGIARASYLVDDLKELGFHYATQAGISISVEDLKVPPIKKKLLANASNEIQISDEAFTRGQINTIERFQNVINTWNNTSEELKDNLVSYFKETDPLNSIYLMAFSGARGNLSQVRQLVGMRGLMSDPKGQIMDIPITHNFREGLTITDYIMSAYGARKGVVDTALKTADSGYLTRRLIDVAQDVIIREDDCQTNRKISIPLAKYKKSDFIKRITGRTCAEEIINQEDNSKIILAKHEEITSEIAEKLYDEKIQKSIKIRSPLTCESTRSICKKCYGWNLAYGKKVDLGEAVGIIAAQSIGEPGTQLTMRTFHTGGIFTADPSRQVRAKNSGYFEYNANIPVKPSRTPYGTDVIKIEREAKCTLTNSKNEIIEFKLVPDSILFAKNNSFVETNDLIAELPAPNQQTVKLKKDIAAPIEGEIIHSKQNKKLWILSGNVFDIPSKSLINKLEMNQTLNKHDSLINFKLSAKTRGLVKVKHNPIDQTINSLKICNCLYLFDTTIYKNKGETILATKDGAKYKLEKLPKSIKKPSFLFASGSNDRYKAPSEGRIFYCNSKFYRQDKNINQNVITKHGKILFIPEETKTVNKDASLLFVPNGHFLYDDEREILKGTFAKTSGLVQTKEANNVIQQITVKPGKFYEYPSLTQKEKKELSKLNKKIFFPGEVIFDDILIEELTIIEVTKNNNIIGLLLRPVEVINILKPNPKKNANLAISKDVSKTFTFTTSEYLHYKSGELITEKSERNLIKSVIYLNLNPTITPKENMTNLEYKMVRDPQTNNHLTLITKEHLNFVNYIPKKLRSRNLKISLFVNDYQFIEPQTIVGKLSLLPNQEIKIKKIKRTYGNLARLLLVGENDYYTTPLEKDVVSCRINEMINKGDNISTNTESQVSGKVTDIKPFACEIHKGSPLFLTSQTTVYKKTNELVQKEEIVGTILYEQVVTGDIVQGLPKVEEILEGRKPQDSAILASEPGIVTFLNEDSKIQVLSNHNNKEIISRNKKNKYQIYQINKKKQKKTFTVNCNDFISLGQPLTDGKISPHELLLTYFEYYKTRKSEYEAAYLSLQNLQTLLVNKVQDVYDSQGVTIADKHIEVIIRQITSKVQITKSGSTLLLPGELIELKQIQYINRIMEKTNRKIASYQPVLLGITKASLLTESFISAASFQETTKILTAAAIEGKIDWLRGLKENVIIGRLIPAGTGFNHKEQIKKIT
jgi:DNA-directed RNA polymerase subunit beta'